MKSGRPSKASQLALAMAIICAVSLPMGFFILGYQRLAIILETEAEANALFASQMINANPEYWPFETIRLNEFLSRSLSPAASEIRRIRKLNGEIVAQNQDAVGYPVIVRDHDLYDSGNVVAKLEIVRSLRPLLWETTLVGVLGCLLIGAIYLVLKKFVLSVQEEAKKSLQESEWRYRLLAENVTDVIWTMNLNLEMTYVSPSAELLRGFTVQETLRQKLEEILTPASLELALRTYTEGLTFAQQENKDLNQVWTLDLEQTCKDGATIWTEVHTRFLYDDAGRPTGILGVTRNIAERKRAEDLLLQEKERYQTLVESAPIGISVIGKNGRYKYVNPKFVEIFGYTLDDIPTGKDWFVKAYPDVEYRRQVMAAWKADLEKAGPGEERPRTFAVTSRNGLEKTINFNTLSIINDDQLVIYEDVTVRRQAEEALKEAKQKWEEIFQAIGHPTMILDPDHGIIEANRATLTLLGKDAAEIRGRKCYEIFHRQGEQPPSECPFQKMHVSGQLETMEMEVAAVEGVFLVSCTPVFDAQGQLQKVIHIATDITARKSAEEALLKYEFIANASKDCMTLIDRNYIYEAANASYCQAHDATREEVVENSVSNIWGAETFEKFIKGFLDQCFTGQAVEFEGWFEFGKMGRGCYNVFYSPYFNADGTVAYAAVVSHDVTERKLAEEELQHHKMHLESLVQERTAQLTWVNEKLQREIFEHLNTTKKLQISLAEKEVLLREIHHRVKNNLQIISSLLNLQLTYPGKKDPREILADSQNRLQIMALIHESLYLSQDLARIPFVRYLREMLARLLQVYKNPEHEIKAAVEGDEVYLDITRAVPCALIANELLTNALKHAFPEGRDGEILVSMKAVGDGFKLSVKDNGVGLPPTDLPNNGTLGMQIVTTLVNQLGGSINWINNGGTECIVEF
jgi:PAS domain S-box-containing protein